MRHAQKLAAFAAILQLLVQTPLVRAETAQYQVATPGAWLPLVAGAEAFGPTDRYVWQSIPSFLTDGNYSFWQNNPGPGWPGVSYGKLSFTVATTGTAYLAVSTRFGSGGNPSGDWLPEVSYLLDLEADGWQPITTGLIEGDRLTGTVDSDYLVLSRDSQAGETFTYRTDKYNPPIPLAQSPPPPPPPTHFVIDPLQSFVTTAVTAGDFLAQAQAPGSLTTSLLGSIAVDLSTPGFVQFVDAGGLSLQDQPGLFRPLNLPAELAASVFDDAGVTKLHGAVRNLGGTLTSGYLAVDANGNFSPNLVLDAKTGVLDFIAFISPSFGLNFPTPLTRTWGNHFDLGSAKLETIGNQQKLTIPFKFESGGGDAFLGLETNFEFSGQIVAYSVVPEPATWGMATFAVLIMATYVGWRRCNSTR